MQGQLSNPGGKKGQGMEMSTYNDLINPMAEEKKNTTQKNVSFISYDIPYMWNLKRNNTNEFTKQKETHRLIERAYGCLEEGIVREFGMDTYTLLYLKWITNKDLLYSTGNSAQCYVAAWMGGGLQGEWIHA